MVSERQLIYVPLSEEEQELADTVITAAVTDPEVQEAVIERHSQGVRCAVVVELTACRGVYELPCGGGRGSHTQVSVPGSREGVGEL